MMMDEDGPKSQGLSPDEDITIETEVESEAN